MKLRECFIKYVLYIQYIRNDQLGRIFLLQALFFFALILAKHGIEMLENGIYK